MANLIQRAYDAAAFRVHSIGHDIQGIAPAVSAKVHEGVEWMQHTVLPQAAEKSRQIVEATYPLRAQAFEGLMAARRTIEWTDRQITHYCDAYLPRPVSAIAKAVIKALPFIIMSTCLPLPALLVTHVAITAFAIITRPEGTSKTDALKSLSPYMLNSFAFIRFGSAAASALSFLRTPAATSLLWTVANTALGVLASLKSGLAQEIFPSLRRRETATTSPTELP